MVKLSSDFLLKSLLAELEDVLTELRGDNPPTEGHTEEYKISYKYGCWYSADRIDNVLYNLQLKGRNKKI